MVSVHPSVLQLLAEAPPLHTAMVQPTTVHNLRVQRRWVHLLSTGIAPMLHLRQVHGKGTFHRSQNLNSF